MPYKGENSINPIHLKPIIKNYPVNLQQTKRAYKPCLQTLFLLSKNPEYRDSYF